MQSCTVYCILEDLAIALDTGIRTFSVYVFEEFLNDKFFIRMIGFMVVFSLFLGIIDYYSIAVLLIDCCCS